MCWKTSIKINGRIFSIILDAPCNTDILAPSTSILTKLGCGKIVSKKSKLKVTTVIEDLISPHCEEPDENERKFILRDASAILNSANPTFSEMTTGNSFIL